MFANATSYLPLKAHRPRFVRFTPMRFRLRILLIPLAVGPPVLAGVWTKYTAGRAEQAVILAAIRLEVFTPTGGGILDVPKDTIPLTPDSD
jgi:hypothetical protein